MKIELVTNYNKLKMKLAGSEVDVMKSVNGQLITMMKDQLRRYYKFETDQEGVKFLEYWVRAYLRMKQCYCLINPYITESWNLPLN